MKLRPGNYTVGVRQAAHVPRPPGPVDEVVDVAAGRDTVLDSERQPTRRSPDHRPVPIWRTGAAPAYDSSSLLQQWRNGVIGIWTPTTDALDYGRFDQRKRYR